MSNAADAGTLQLLFNPNNATGFKWEVQRTGEDDSQGGITFTMTDAGVVQFTTSTLSGLNHQGVLSYAAKALQYA